mgnify:CR=1 FL=1
MNKSTILYYCLIFFSFSFIHCANAQVYNYSYISKYIETEHVIGVHEIDTLKVVVAKNKNNSIVITSLDHCNFIERSKVLSLPEEYSNITVYSANDSHKLFLVIFWESESSSGTYILFINSSLQTKLKKNSSDGKRKDKL